MGISSSIDHLECQVCCLGRVDHTRAFQFDLLRTHSVEQAGSITKQHRDKVDPEFVDQSSFDELLDSGRAADDSDVFVARGCLGLRQRVLDAVSDEDVGCSSLLRVRTSS